MRAKLLAAGAATCAYQIAAKAVVSKSALFGGIGKWLKRRELFSRIKCEDKTVRGIVDSLKPPLSASSWAQRQPKRFPC